MTFDNATITETSPDIVLQQLRALASSAITEDIEQVDPDNQQILIEPNQNHNQNELVFDGNGEIFMVHADIQCPIEPILNIEVDGCY